MYMQRLPFEISLLQNKKNPLLIYSRFVHWPPAFVQESADNHKAASAISYITPFVYSQNRKYNFPSAAAGNQHSTRTYKGSRYLSAFLSYIRHENGLGNRHGCNPNVQASFSDFPHIINREKYDRGCSPAANIRRKIK